MNQTLVTETVVFNKLWLSVSTFRSATTKQEINKIQVYNNGVINRNDHDFSLKENVYDKIKFSAFIFL